MDGYRYALLTRQIWRNEILPAERPRNYEDAFGVAL